MGSRLVAFVAVGALVASACGGGDDGDVGAAAALRATLVVQDEDGDHREAGVEDRTPVAEVETAFGGDRIQTYRTGDVDLRYDDGSFTRVGPQTEFQLVALSGSVEAPDIDVRLDLGRTWHNVQDLGEDGSYEVATAVGTAAVRGTSFAVVCEVVDRCTITVAIGEVDVLLDGAVALTLGPGGFVVLGPDGIEEQGRLDGPGLRQDPWVDENLDRDGDEPGPFDGPAQATGGQVPANEAEVIAATAFNAPWVEAGARNDDAGGWVNDVWNFPETAGFEPPTPEQEAQLVADGFVSQRNRQFEILGPDEETGSDDHYAAIRAGDFGTAEQAAAAVAKSNDAALGRSEGASAFDTGLPDVLGTTWTYTIAKCTPVGGTFDCQDEPPWTVYRASLSTDRFAVVIEAQYPTGSDARPDEVLAIAGLLREVFVA